MFFARLKSLTQTLRFRIAAWNASVVLLTAVATLLALREGIRFTLLDEVDTILREDLREVVLAIPARNYPASESLYEDLNRKAQAHELHGWYVRFLDKSGDEIWASHGAPRKTPPLPSLKDYSPIHLNNFRVVQVQQATATTPAVTVRVGSSLDTFDRNMLRIDEQGILVAGLVFVLAPLCGYWLAGRATQPLAEIIHTTSRLHPAELADRLPIRGTGDELDKLARTVNALLDRIAYYLEQRGDFLANAAHELRTPLAAIRSSIEVGLNGNRSAEEYQELLADLLDECAMLESLVNQLLLLAETESDTLRVHKDVVLWNKIAERSIDMFRAVAENAEIELQADVAADVSVEGNQNHLRQVLNNLLDNALKYTPAGGQIAVRMFVDTVDNRAVLRVTDTGRGISPTDLPHVFERFYRCDKSRPRDQMARGTGLGLSICQAIVQAHGGHISVQSTLGHGTAFTVSLPLAPVATG